MHLDEPRVELDALPGIGLGGGIQALLEQVTGRGDISALQRDQSQPFERV